LLSYSKVTAAKEIFTAIPKFGVKYIFTFAKAKFANILHFCYGLALVEITVQHLIHIHIHFSWK
jgi:hypothetical protein